MGKQRVLRSTSLRLCNFHILNVQNRRRSLFSSLFHGNDNILINMSCTCRTSKQTFCAKNLPSCWKPKLYFVCHIDLLVMEWEGNGTGTGDVKNVYLNVLLEMISFWVWHEPFFRWNIDTRAVNDKLRVHWPSKWGKNYQRKIDSIPWSSLSKQFI